MWLKCIVSPKKSGQIWVGQLLVDNVPVDDPYQIITCNWINANKFENIVFSVMPDHQKFYALFDFSLKSATFVQKDNVASSETPILVKKN